MPASIVFDDQTTYVTDPVDPCAGEDFTVSWQERNIGDEDAEPYQDTFDLDADGVGASRALQCDGIPAGGTATRSLTFNLPAGDYQMTLVLRAGAPAVLGNVIVIDCPR
nr:hypothetical protein [uncultured Duganella sp.]